jgi:hypothetical protein
MSDQQHYIERIRILLQDTGLDRWESETLTLALRHALLQYSRALPDQAITTVNVTASSRELSIAAITPRLQVIKVWLPYTAASPEHPPNWRNFEEWPGDLLYFPDDSQPSSGNVARIFYSRPRTLSGLDGAQTTTIKTPHEDIIITGAAGFAALARAEQLAETVTAEDNTYSHLHGWGFTRQNEFRAELNRLKNTPAGGFVPAGQIRRKRVPRS